MENNIVDPLKEQNVYCNRPLELSEVRNVVTKSKNGTYTGVDEILYECKTNTIPILMHQMCILTTQVSSVMLRSKKLEIRKQMWKRKEPSDENQTDCYEIEPNSSKERAMPEGDNPLFWDEFNKICIMPQMKNLKNTVCTMDDAT
jgi:hypothetical protein